MWKKNDWIFIIFNVKKFIRKIFKKLKKSYRKPKNNIPGTLPVIFKAFTL